MAGHFISLMDTSDSILNQSRNARPKQQSHALGTTCRFKIEIDPFHLSTQTRLLTERKALVHAMIPKGHDFPLFLPIACISPIVLASQN